MPERRSVRRSHAGSPHAPRADGWPPPPHGQPDPEAQDEPRYERMPLVVPLGALFVVAVAMASLFGRMFLIR